MAEISVFDILAEMTAPLPSIMPFMYHITLPIVVRTPRDFSGEPQIYVFTSWPPPKLPPVDVPLPAVSNEPRAEESYWGFSVHDLQGLLRVKRKRGRGATKRQRRKIREKHGYVRPSKWEKNAQQSTNYES